MTMTKEQLEAIRKTLDAKADAGNTGAGNTDADPTPTANETGVTTSTKNVSVTFIHLATEKKIKFVGTGLRSFKDSFASNWASEPVYGRQDPIMTFQNTQRSITVEMIVTKETDVKIWKSDGTPVKKATNGVEGADMLARFLYPTYSDDFGALSIKEPPLLRILFGSLLKSTQGQGLLCACTSFSLERGDSFSPGIERGASGQKIEANQIIIGLSLTPLHEFNLGYVQQDDSGLWTFGGTEGGDYWFPTSKIISGE